MSRQQSPQDFDILGLKHPQDKKVINRIEGETDKAWQAFQDFCNMGVGRTLADLCRQYINSDQQNALPPTTSDLTIRTWSAKFNWFERAREWDSQQEKSRMELLKRNNEQQWEDDARAFMDRNRRAGSLLFESAITCLKKSLSVLQTEELTVDQAIRLMGNIGKLIEIAQSTEGTALNIAQLLEKKDFKIE